MISSIEQKRYKVRTNSGVKIRGCRSTVGSRFVWKSTALREVMTKDIYKSYDKDIFIYVYIYFNILKSII